MLSDRCLSYLSLLSVTLVYCSQTVGWIRMALGVEIGLGLGDIVLDWDPAAPPPQNGGTTHQFLAHVSCGHMAGWIKMPLGTEVGLVPDSIVLDSNSAPPWKGAQQPPLFGPLCSGMVALVAHLSNCCALVIFGKMSNLLMAYLT